MERSALAAQAERFHALHAQGGVLALLNAWDAGSARVFESAGCPAIGTTSAGIAYALGRPDGEALTRTELVEATARMARAVAIPVTADVETGYGATPAEVGETVAAVLDAGAVGVNLEDVAAGGGGAAGAGGGGAAGGGVAGGGAALRDAADQGDRLAAARAAGEAAAVRLFVNARTDVWWLGVGEPQERLELAIERARAYVEAGADGIFAPGIADPREIELLAGAVGVPLNVLATRATPPLGELERLGVRRLSVGSGPIRAVLDLAGRIALDVLETGDSDLLAAGTLTYREANELFR